MTHRPRTTIFQLTLVGFLVAVFPLMAALIWAMIGVDALSQEIRDTVFRTSQVAQSSRSLIAHVLSMERSAGQFLVLSDPNVLARYEEQRAQLHAIVTSLLALPPAETTIQHLEELLERENDLYLALIGHQQSRHSDPTDVEGLGSLETILRPIPIEVSNAISAQAQSLTHSASHLEQILFIQSVSLVPLGLLLAVGFSFLVTKPLKQLSLAIRRLGEGNLIDQIVISGPADVSSIGERLEWLRKHLSDLEEQKVQFCRHVSHELKTPLASIREGVELLGDEVVGKLNEGQAEIISIVLANSKQLQTQIENLLKFNSALIEEQDTQRALTDLAQLVHQSADDRKMVLLSRRLFIDLELSPISIHANSDQLRAVIDNLLSNAINYSPDDSTIGVRLTSDRTSVILDVQDEGVGIDASERERVFEPYYRGKNIEHAATVGTGLGLAICHRYVTLHHGTIKILDSNRGAHFQVRLPLAQEGT